MIRKFRKKPVVHDGIMWTGDNLSDVEEFVGKKLKEFYHNGRQQNALVVPILEPPYQSTAFEGDFILRAHSQKKGHFCWPVTEEYLLEFYTEEANGHL